MSRESLDTELADLTAHVEELGRLVETRLELALEALRTGDEAVARRVIDGDDAVNERYLALERRCVDLFALQQPVASDLRRVAATFKISTDLERVGDLAVNLAGYATELERDLYPEVSVEAIGETALSLVRDAIAVYLEPGDRWTCHEIADRDTELDAMCAHAGDVVTRALIDREVDTGDVTGLVEDVTTLLLTVRDLERVGDHAVNVAARTLYMTEGDDALLE